MGLYVPGGHGGLPLQRSDERHPRQAGRGEGAVHGYPRRGKDGKIPQHLAAARVCGVDRVFRVGGAQAVAALAYGTESVPRVDKIVGPGNAYVAEAKRQVFGQVAIDMVAGPSEILVIADGGLQPSNRGGRPPQPGRARQERLGGAGDRQRGPGPGRPGRHRASSCPS